MVVRRNLWGEGFGGSFQGRKRGYKRPGGGQQIKKLTALADVRVGWGHKKVKTTQRGKKVGNVSGGEVKHCPNGAKNLPRQPKTKKGATTRNGEKTAKEV